MLFSEFGMTPGMAACQTSGAGQSSSVLSFRHPDGAEAPSICGRCARRCRRTIDFIVNRDRPKTVDSCVKKHGNRTRGGEGYIYISRSASWNGLKLDNDSRKKH